MPAPDVPPPLAFPASERPLHVHLHVKLAPPESLAGAVVIVIDALRASVTMTAALAHGAACVIPALTVEDALAKQRALAGAPTLLGGERGGILIPGFDLDNSPVKYTPERVRGRTVIFTTTNGTAALLHASRAAEILVGSFANLSAVSAAVAADPRPVHILCCGTRDELSLDDILPAGAFVEKLSAAGRGLTAEDSARVALLAWQGARAQSGGHTEAMRQSRGGRNLARQSLGPDVDYCSQLDRFNTVPKFDAALGRVVV